MVILDSRVEDKPDCSGGEGKKESSKQKKQHVYKLRWLACRLCGGEGGWRGSVLAVTCGCKIKGKIYFATALNFRIGRDLSDHVD